VTKQDDLRSIADSSGYPYQERIVHEIKRTNGDHHWAIILEEHRWIDLLDDRERFIDLVLRGPRERGLNHLVIEVKRTRADWAFLPHLPIYEHEQHAHRFTTVLRSQKQRWSDCMVAPTSNKAKFCMVQGRGGDDSPMLERMSGILLRSVEAVAREELSIGNRTHYADAPFHYYPLIVTNAKLYLCQFAAGKVDIDTGNLPADTEFSEVPFLRFTKSLSSYVLATPEDRMPASLETAHSEGERTVFVVNGAKLSSFLIGWGAN
jgi:hypothetical protein